MTRHDPDLTPALSSP